jgi:hypothetical protein
MNGTVKLNQFLQFTKLFKDEEDKNVWSVIAGALQYCDRAFSSDKKAIEKLRALTVEILSPTYKRLGWEVKAKESELTKQLRGLAISTLGTTGGDKDVSKEAAARYDKHLSGEVQLAPDVLSAVVAVLACKRRARSAMNNSKRPSRTAPRPKSKSATCTPWECFKMPPC